MRLAFAILIGIHGWPHLLGPAKAFRSDAVDQLRTPISALGGLLWLVVPLALLIATAGVAGGARWWGGSAFPAFCSRSNEFVRLEPEGVRQHARPATVAYLVPWKEV